MEGPTEGLCGVSAARCALQTQRSPRGHTHLSEAGEFDGSSRSPLGFAEGAEMTPLS